VVSKLLVGKSPSLSAFRAFQEKLRATLDTFNNAVSTLSFTDKIDGVKNLHRIRGKVSEEEFLAFTSCLDDEPLVKIENPVHASFLIVVPREPDVFGYVGKVQFRTSKLEDDLIINFLNALDGVPLAALRKCPECGKWFFHGSRRIKEFCSNKCAARKVSRMYRQKVREEKHEEYEEEKDSGRERAHNSYAARVRKVHPKAKVERRPLKKRTDAQELR
jgi:hypothetical protein